MTTACERLREDYGAGLKLAMHGSETFVKISQAGAEDTCNCGGHDLVESIGK